MRFCPGCGAPVDGSDTGAASFVQEFWSGPDRNFLCWCAACDLLCTVVLPAMIVSHEPEH
jgi:hypothetical protein